MRIAIPIADGKLAMHFGHCELFALVDVDEGKQIVDQSEVAAPPHQPGLLPKWLSERGVSVVIAGGMGRRAQSLFTQAGVSVVVGAPMLPVHTLVERYLEGKLEAGLNPCDH